MDLTITKRAREVAKERDWPMYAIGTQWPDGHGLDITGAIKPERAVELELLVARWIGEDNEAKKGAA